MMQQPPLMADPPMTFDEASMQGSRHFYMALQELKNLQPQLYSAAEYCESSYLFNDQKQVVLENLKDYAVKALVNAVDHLGTVAYKLDEVLSQQIAEIASTEIRVAGLQQRVCICQEYRNVEAGSQQQPAKPTRRFHKHYLLPDALPDHKFKDERVENRDDKFEAQASSVMSGVGKTLLWHLATDPLNTTKASHPVGQQTPNRFAPSTSESQSPISEPKSSKSASEVRSPNRPTLLSPSRATLPSPSPRANDRLGHRQQSPSEDISKPMSALHSFDNKFSNPQKMPATSRSKSLLSSLLGRKRSGKSRGEW